VVVLKKLGATQDIQTLFAVKYGLSVGQTQTLFTLTNPGGQVTHTRVEGFQKLGALQATH